VVTVMVTKVDLGGEGNFIVAMVIATIKAGLVMAYFMHLRWDKKFNVVVFLSSFLFVTLFLGILLTDRKEYQDVIDSFERVQAAAEAQG
jgi:cytochrome c oxidase subunit 4